MKSRNFKQYCLYIVVTVIILAASFLLPRFLLLQNGEKYCDTIIDISPSRYASSQTVLAREYSRKMSSEEQLKLINGIIPSTRERCSLADGFITEAEAVEMARAIINHKSSTGEIDYSLKSAYINWYSWNSELYSYTDTTFNAYTAYVWEITFVKFDHSIAHKICITENGDLISLETIPVE